MESWLNPDALSLCCFRHNIAIFFPTPSPITLITRTQKVMCVKFSNIKVTNKKKMYFCAVKAEGKGL